MGISLLRLSSTNHSTHKDVIGLHFNVFVDTFVGFPNDYSQLILVKRWWVYFMGWGTDPIFLLD
jgi:hypothetical protein